jgi:BirA family biotin operon repressor/biotin-[acetyl-CoA-carboxylase] ligase
MTKSPDLRPPLDPARLAALAPRWRVEVAAETPSTNAVAAERARAGEPEGLVVTTEHQTAGRGRLDRVWETPARSAVALSAVLRPDVPGTRWPWLPLLAGVAVTEALRDLGYDAGVKWPNDVLIADQKVCGILVERVETASGPAAVVGIGLNTSMTADELPVPTATSLAVAGGAPVDRTAVLVAVLQRLVERYEAWLADPAELGAAYPSLSVTLGRAVRVELPSGEVLAGTATAIDADGRLVVAHDGTRTTVGAGDVIHARLA